MIWMIAVSFLLWYRIGARGGMLFCPLSRSKTSEELKRKEEGIIHS